MKIINIVGTAKAHFGRNTYRHGQETYGLDNCYEVAREVLRLTKIYVLGGTIDNAEHGTFRSWQAAFERRKALAVTDTDLGLAKQRIIDPSTLQADAPEYNFTGSASLALYEAVKAGATEVVLYRVNLTAKNYAEMEALLHNVAWAEAQGVNVVWAWRKYVASQVRPAAPEVVAVEAPAPKQRKPRKSKKKDN